MKRVILGIFIISSACSVTKESSNVDVDMKMQKIEDGANTVTLYDRTDYYLTVDKPYFIVLPVRNYLGRHYLVDNNNYIITYFSLENMLTKTPLVFNDHPNIQRYFVPKYGQRTITFGDEIEGFVVWAMGPWYTSTYITTFGKALSKPLGFHSSTGKVIDHLQRLGYSYQNYYINGHYWHEVFVTRIDSYLTTD